MVNIFLKIPHYLTPNNFQKICGTSGAYHVRKYPTVLLATYHAWFTEKTYVSPENVNKSALSCDILRVTFKMLVGRLTNQSQEKLGRGTTLNTNQ